VVFIKHVGQIGLKNLTDCHSGCHLSY